jgi:hypothetical protein
MTYQPYDFGEALRESRRRADAQEKGEREVRLAARDAAKAEHAYRVALARRITELHDSGVAWSVCADLARGDEHVAVLRRTRDVRQGLLEAAQQSAWRLSADRKDAHAFITWSMRRDLAEGFGDVLEPAAEQAVTFGGRSAA